MRINAYKVWGEETVMTDAVIVHEWSPRAAALRYRNCDGNADPAHRTFVVDDDGKGTAFEIEVRLAATEVEW